MSEPTLSPADRARSEVVGAVLRCLVVQHENDGEAESALEMLDLAAIRLVAELEARQAR